MNFQRGGSKEELELNLIPLIDVLLVILIFLFVTTTYSKYAELQINLPQASGEPPQPGERPLTLNVAVDAGGRYVINNSPTPFFAVGAFSEALKRAAGGADDPIVSISADAGATHQSVVNIMEAARLAGFTHITFTTQSQLQ